MQFSIAAMVKAMKIQEIILRAISGQILWIDAADIIGVSYRTMKRWKTRYEQFGYDGIFDRRMKKPSPKRVPLKETQTILTLYSEKYMGFNIAHFYDKLSAHGIKRSYTFVKTLLQAAGLVKKAPKKGRHRRKHPRRPLIGMMLYLDGSPHEWIPALPGQLFDLLVLMDDATNEIYNMMLVPEEDTLSCMSLLKNCVKKHGIKTVEEANRFLKERYIKEHNNRFTVSPEQPGSAFIPVAKHINLDLIFSIREQRVVNPDNTVSFQRHTLQIDASIFTNIFRKMSC